MTAARFDQPWPPRAARTMRADIDAGNGARRTAPHAAFKTGDKGRLGETLLQPAGDDADHAGMPALARHQQERRIGLGRGQAMASSRISLLDRLAFAIVQIELRGEFRRRFAPRARSADRRPATSAPPGRRH